MKEMVFRAKNVHVSGCGDPPDYTADEKHYSAYFENEYGEQWVFSFDRASKRGTLRGGDLGWGESVPVVGGAPGTTILSPAEGLWLAACWMAATGASFEEIKKNRGNTLLSLLNQNATATEKVQGRTLPPGTPVKTADLQVGGRYLHRSGAQVREILRIVENRVFWRDSIGEGACLKSVFIKQCPTVAP